MKKNLYLCFLGYLCLPISTTLAQVADPPGADLLHRSMPHRGGDSRSDTFLNVTSQEIDGGPILLSSVSSLPSQKGFSLVDTAEFQNQEAAIPSAPSGALIYGEIINPDSLSPIHIEFLPNPAGPSIALEVESSPGTFFDGVLDPRVRKFQLALPFTADFGYFSLSVGSRPLLADFLLSPTDSIKISLDLESSTIVFGGPQAAWFEAQYQIARAKKQARFDAPRTLYQNNPEALLDQADYREQWKEANSRFGARLSFASFGGDGIDQGLAALEVEEMDLIPGFQVLESAKDQLTSAQYGILKAELLGNYFASKISSFRKYQYTTPLSLGDSGSVRRVQALLPGLNSKLGQDLEALPSSAISSGYGRFLYEWLKLRSIETGNSLLDLILSETKGEQKARMTATYVDEELAKGYFDLGFLAGLLPQFPASSWKTYLENLQTRMKLEVELAPVTFRTLEGGQFALDDFRGTPTLFYFYFSTCAHSANYFHRYLWPIYRETAKQAGYQLVAVSVDDDPALWKSAIADYSDPSLLNLNLPKTENKNWLDRYLVHTFPRTMLLDEGGKLLSLNLTGEDYESYKDNLLEYLNPKTISSTITKTP